MRSRGRVRAMRTLPAQEMLRAFLAWRPRAARGGSAARCLAWWLVLLAALGGTLARAQSSADGGLRGRVVDAAGAPLSHATVSAQSVATGLREQTLTGPRGEFLMVRLPPGEYRIAARAPGSPIGPETSPVTVALGEVTEVELTLSATAMQVTPLASNAGSTADDALAVQPQAADGEPQPGESAVSDRAEGSSRRDGASADESFSAAPLGTGVEEDGSAGADAEPERSAGPGSGWRSVEDGGRRAGAAYTFSQAAVRAFRVTGQGDAAAYGSALYGHGVGGVVTAISRSGEARLHGMAFYTVRDSVWAAENPFNVATHYRNAVVASAVVKPADLRQQFGGRIGGPVRADWLRALTPGLHTNPPAASQPGSRLFYFYAFDAQRRGFPAISSPGYAGFYTLTPTQTALLANRGVTSAKTMAALNYLESLTGTVERRADQTVNFARLDWQRGGGEQFVAEYNRARWSNPAGARSSPVVDRGVASLGSSFGAVDMGVARWVRFLRPLLSHELRVQYGRELQYEAAQTPLPQEPGVGPGGLPPEVSIGPQGFVFGTPAGLGRKAYPEERRLDLAEVLAWVHGGHLLQIGADFSAISDRTNSLTNAEGTFSYDSGTTNGRAGGLVDWITDYTFNVHAYPNGGCPSINAAVHYFCFRSYSQSFGQQGVSFARQEWAGFVQDDWHVSPKLTVHAGLRYDYELLPFPQRPNAALDAVFGARGATSVFPEDRNNFGPRLGIAWQPDGFGHGVVRAGYGVYFGRLPGSTLQAALLDTATAGGVSRIRILPTTETLCPQAAGVGFGYVCSYLTAPAGVVAATTSAVVFDRGFRLPMVQQGTVSVEHGLGAGLLGRIGYVTNSDRQLPNTVDLNIAPATAERVFRIQGAPADVGQTFAAPVYTARLSPSFGPVTDLVSHSNATYHGVTAELRRGLGGGRAVTGGRASGLEFRVAWTWSKAIDFGQTAGARPRSNGQFDPFEVRYDKGLSALNFPHRVAGSVVWTPRMEGLFSAEGAGRMVRAVLSGWTVAAIGSEASGRGYSYRIFGGTRLPGGRESINGSGGSTVLPTVGRNTLRLPDSATVDLRVARVVAVGDGMRLRGAVEAFNVANHVSVTGVEQRGFLVGTAVNGVTPLVFQDAAAIAREGLNVLPFGTFTSSASGQARERQVELSLRLEF